MKKSLKRMAVAAAAAGAIGASSLVAAPQAQAAPPGDLMLIGGVSCTFKAWGPNWNDGPLWQMRRWMGVVNVGGSTMTGVTVSELGGANRWVPANKARGTKTGQLKPGQTSIVFDTKWKGCWPSSISGYTIGQQVENPFNNGGFWQNVRRAEAK
ncbi:hypothetical protein [Gordonia sp. (in: high G+C Gram-positive bacteria)]|uniref:hypothetical protein n=1 Tax=Gordonia sp. (in: high G+C Gram-positive bacteria) TaxID=84139 RepID=UPI00168FF8A5|nr:hypothetical protein [Gordonia sp. (in: high G+C Gram-positive bacteria)]NLG47005.1 hypothetical protein [Gordonia sp. (in: high G+C Gram-positive bacteria)]